MIHTTRANRGMVVAPHHLAAEAGLRVLRDGGNAIEAMIASAATIAVVYPHMNGLGGDNFWLLKEPGGTPVAIDACGAAAAQADIAFYRNQGLQAIPARGALAANTVAGAVSGWHEAWRLSQRDWQGRLPLARLLEDAEYYAENGVPVSASQHLNTASKHQEMIDAPGFAALYRPAGATPAIGALFRNPALARTLRHLSETGLDDFYRGALARNLATELAKAGSPLRLADFEKHRARQVNPLQLNLNQGTVYNLPPPTQGLASLIVLGLYAQFPAAETETFAYLHTLIEASKLAFQVRDRHICDPDRMRVDPSGFLDPQALRTMAAGIDPQRAAPWGSAGLPGDTVWLGAIDAQGRAVSFIQSIYWEFGSGLVLPESGITWQNRGTSFQLDENAVNALGPGRKPFHTIQPALAVLADGRVMPYGTMGGEGQPQTQAAIFSRYVLYGQSLQQAVSAPRWLLGRTWGSQQTRLRIENRFDKAVIDALIEAGHDVEVVGSFDEIMGHAGALVHHPDGLIEGASDPRSDGSVAAF